MKKIKQVKPKLKRLEAKRTQESEEKNEQKNVENVEHKEEEKSERKKAKQTSEKKKSARKKTDETKKNIGSSIVKINEEYESILIVDEYDSKKSSSLKRLVKKELSLYKDKAEIEEEKKLIEDDEKNLEKEFDKLNEEIDKYKKHRKEEQDKIREIKKGVIKGNITDGSLIEHLSLNIDYFNKKLEECSKRKKELAAQKRKLTSRRNNVNKYKAKEENQEDFEKLQEIFESISNIIKTKKIPKPISEKEKTRRDFVEKFKLERKKFEAGENSKKLKEEEKAKRKAEEDAKKLKEEAEAKRKAEDEAKNLKEEKLEEKPKKKFKFFDYLKKIWKKIKKVVLNLKENIAQRFLTTLISKKLIEKEHISNEDLWKIETMKKLRERILAECEINSNQKKYEFDEDIEKVISEEVNFIKNMYNAKEIPQEEKTDILSNIFKKVYNITSTNHSRFGDNLSAIYEKGKYMRVFKDIIKGNFDYDVKRYTVNLNYNNSELAKDIRYLKKAINHGMKVVEETIKKPKANIRTFLPREYLANYNLNNVRRVLLEQGKNEILPEDKKTLEKIKLCQLAYYFDCIDLEKALRDMDNGKDSLNLEKILKRITQGGYAKKKQSGNPWEVKDFKWDGAKLKDEEKKSVPKAKERVYNF